MLRRDWSVSDDGCCCVDVPNGSIVLTKSDWIEKSFYTMEKDLSSFTYENLNSLKYKELHKLSVQFKVMKRWATKQDIIENLLALKGTSKGSTEFGEDVEWKDGREAVKDFNVQAKGNDQIDRRLTFNINSNKEIIDPRATFEISKPIKDINLNKDGTDSRATFEVSKPIKNINFNKDARATFEVNKAGESFLNKKSDSVDSRATFDIPQNRRKLLENVTQNTGVVTRQSEAKMLTIPLTRIAKKSKDTKEHLKTNSKSNLKISQKSINIKKIPKTPSRSDSTAKSPFRMQKQKEEILSGRRPEIKIRRLPLGKELGIISRNSIPAGKENKENEGRTMRRKSKTEDNTLMKVSNLSKVTFLTPPASGLNRNKSTLRKASPKRKTSPSRVSKIPKAKALANVVVTKPITATKMPDFASIHKKRFEQMDSLHDYQRKKAERARKLFGTPQPGVPKTELKNSPKPASSVFKFTSSNVIMNKENNLVAKNAPVFSKGLGSKATSKEIIKRKAPASPNARNIKEKSRSVIHGVRMNKRFELQMKFRNLQD